LLYELIGSGHRRSKPLSDRVRIGVGVRRIHRPHFRSEYGTGPGGFQERVKLLSETEILLQQVRADLFQEFFERGAL
jgi:hypothetical protein